MPQGIRQTTSLETIASLAGNYVIHQVVGDHIERCAAHRRSDYRCWWIRLFDKEYESFHDI